MRSRPGNVGIATVRAWRKASLEMEAVCKAKAATLLAKTLKSRSQNKHAGRGQVEWKWPWQDIVSHHAVQIQFDQCLAVAPGIRQAVIDIVADIKNGDDQAADNARNNPAHNRETSNFRDTCDITGQAISGGEEPILIDPEQNAAHDDRKVGNVNHRPEAVDNKELQSVFPQ